MSAESTNPASATASLHQKLNKLIASSSQDYNPWRSLILDIETHYQKDINTISLAYDALLSKFPLCHWHLKKYAHHKAELCSLQDAVNIYEWGLRTGMYSIGFWVDYCTFGAACFGDPEDVRRLFRRAILFVDKDYYCHALWDMYMKYEFNLEGWSFLAQSYVEALRFPTKKLQFYYDNFKQFVANLKEEIGYENSDCIVEQVPYAAKETYADEISLVIKDLLESPDCSIKSQALDRYKAIGEEFYHGSRQMDEKIRCFEKKIQRRYFCANPLDDDELDNWHLYIDFIEKQGDMDWAMKLYERCLIPCASYPEFWMRYVEFLNSKGGRELAISALKRATQTFLKNVLEIHLFDAKFKEHIGDINATRAALSLCDMQTDSSFLSSVVTLANLERRLGNFAAASATYEKALITTKERGNAHIDPSLYFHFSQLTLLTTGSAAAAMNILIRGVRHVPHCRFLLEELIKFATTHEGPRHVNVIDRIIGDAISNRDDESGGLSYKDREDISNLFLEFVNLCGTSHDIRKAWHRHIRSFPMSLRMKTSYKNSKSSHSDAVQLLQSTTLSNGQEKPETDPEGPTRTTAPPAATSEGTPAPAAPNHIVSYSGEESWKAQMFYHYQQQQFLLQQQQYQQQLQMQGSYSQMQYNYYNQQPYQPHQQQFGPQPQQNNQQNQQLWQGQEQYHQSHNAAYQAYESAYQQQAQQILLHQYEQYQDYHLPHQQQPTDGPGFVQEQQKSTQNMSQNQQALQGSREAPAEHDATAETSKSPHPRARSPQKLE